MAAATAFPLEFAHYDGVAPAYDSLLRNVPDDWYRQAFHLWISRWASTGCDVLDFGCGTGQDARWLASEGHHVAAHDPSRGMISVLRKSCATEINNGEIVVVDDPWVRPVELVMANYAVLNLIEDLQDFFVGCEKILGDGGHVLLSLLNPFYWGDVIEGWWHRGRSTLGSTGVMMRTAARPVFRHYVSHLLRVAGNGFERVGQAGVGAFLRSSAAHPQGMAAAAERRLWQRRPSSWLGKYIFLALRRTS